MGIGDDQLDALEAPSRKRAQERQPAGTILVGYDIQAQRLPVALAVDPDRDQAGHVDGTAVLADLHRQRVQRDERVVARVERPATERLHLCVQV